MKANELFSSHTQWLNETKDVRVYNLVYVDMTADPEKKGKIHHPAGMLLSQMVYWSSPNEKGKIRLRVEHDGHLWVSKSRREWYDELRLTD